LKEALAIPGWESLVEECGLSCDIKPSLLSIEREITPAFKGLSRF